METYKAQNGAPGPLQTAEPSTRQSLAGKQRSEAAFAATQGQYQDEETRLEHQAATEWAQEEVLEDVLKDALEQAHFQEQEAEEAASGSAEKRYQHSFARPAERDLGRSSARPFARPSAWPSASPSGNRSGNPSASPLGHPSGNRSASPSGRPSVPLYESSRVRSADDSGEETEALGAAVYEDRLSRSLTDRLADRQDSTAAGYQEAGLRSPEERAWKRRPASSEAVYAKAGLSAAEAQWIDSINAIDILKDEKVALETILQCPLSFVGSSDFVVLSGILLGRFLAMDDQGRRDVRADLKRLYSYIGGWSLFEPEACGFLLAIVDPEVIYACILFWPEKHRRERAFFVSVLLGLFAENARGTEFLRNGGVDMLLDIIEGERRPGTLLSAI